MPNNCTWNTYTQTGFVQFSKDSHHNIVYDAMELNQESVTKLESKRLELNISIGERDDNANLKYSKYLWDSTKAILRGIYQEKKNQLAKFPFQEQKTLKIKQRNENFCFRPPEQHFSVRCTRGHGGYLKGKAGKANPVGCCHLTPLRVSAVHLRRCLSGDLHSP